MNKRSAWAILLCIVMLFVATSCLTNGSSTVVEANADKAAAAGLEVVEVTVDESKGTKAKKYSEWFVEEDDQTRDLEVKKDWKYYILMPVGWFLTQINKIVPSYVFTLFVFAILMKLLFLPFSIYQQKNMIKQAKFKPTERAIRNRYKGRTDQATMQKMQQEIMDAQKKAGVSTFGGCLPMLIQLPAIYLLYEVIRNPLSYVAGYSQATITGIKNVLCYNDISSWDLSNLSSTVRNALLSGNAGTLNELNLVPLLRDHWDAFQGVAGMADKTVEGLPNFYAFGNYVDLSVTPTVTFNWPLVLYLLIPIITFVALFFSMRLNRKMTAGATSAPVEGQPDMRMANVVMDIGMPAMSAFFTFMFPAVLGVYWIFNNILATVQQFILKKVMPFPTFTEEDYKQAEREYNKGKEPVKKAEKKENDPNKPKVRSLHHIDDDDED